MWPKFGDPSGQLVSSLTVCSLLLLLSLGWLVGDAYGAVVERRATLQQARCVAACLEQASGCDYFFDTVLCGNNRRVE